jgi:hypothetical protein
VACALKSTLFSDGAEVPPLLNISWTEGRKTMQDEQDIVIVIEDEPLRDHPDI